MPTSTISYLWRDPGAARTFQTGVSLHSHTNQSQETLDFVADWGLQYKLVKPMLERLERRSKDRHGIHINWKASYWTPPLTPKLAFDLESNQIAKLGVAPLVSVSDHDNIQAPLLLRSVRLTAASRPARNIFISASTTCPALAPRSGWTPSPNSPLAPTTPASPNC
jgi:hypothetical protein